MANNATSQAHARVISRAWQDPAFKQQLMSNPSAALAQEGITVPAGTNVQVHENTPGTSHIVIPAKPAAGVTGAAASPSAVVLCVICSEGGGDGDGGGGVG